MKSINLMSLVNARRDLIDQDFQHYIRMFQLNPKIRDSELADLSTLLEELKKVGAEASDFNDFFFGFSIHQISKEFDLLRIGENFVLNVELKLESPVDRIEYQLMQNAHYLRFLNVPVFNFTFVSKTKKLYKLENGQLLHSNLGELLQLMRKQTVEVNIDIDELFSPICYLVSPIEETAPFMDGQYFLTAQQTTFKMEIMNRPKAFRVWYAIEGGSGTGKTLLTYDIAKQYMMQGHSVTLAHCLPLQQGQRMLNEQYGWDIVHINNMNFDKPCEILIIDEAHHLTRKQVQDLLLYEQKYHPKIILSYDAEIYFNGAAIIREIEHKVKLIRFELKIIIRYNKEIYTFTNCLFDLSYESVYTNYKRISVQYFTNYEDAEVYLKRLKENEWKIINVVRDMEIQEITISNDLIGQEFDYVAALLDEHFYYKTNLRLSCYGIDFKYDQPTKILFQAMTRTRKELHLVIVNNTELLKNILNILNPH